MKKVGSEKWSCGVMECWGQGRLTPKAGKWKRLPASWPATTSGRMPLPQWGSRRSVSLRACAPPGLHLSIAISLPSGKLRLSTINSPAINSPIKKRPAVGSHKGSHYRAVPASRDQSGALTAGCACSLAAAKKRPAVGSHKGSHYRAHPWLQAAEAAQS